MRGVPRAVLLAVALLTLPAGAPLRGQMPFTGVGLGYPVAPVDARAAALGSTGVGLLGGTFTLRSPADLLVHPTSAISISIVPEDVDVEGPAGTNHTGRSRFSVIRAVTRVDRWAVGIGFGGALDQDFEVRLEDTLALAVGRFPFEEVREHDGGVSAIDLSLARELGPLLLGVGIQRLTGSLRQSFTRRFQPDVEESGTTLENVFDETRLSYGAWRLKGGASLRLGGRGLVGGSFGLTGEMEADVDTLPPLDPRSAPASRSFDMPRSAEVGGSLAVTQRLLVTAAAGWEGWSSVDGAFEGVEAEDARWAGAGIEYRLLRVLGVGVPVRVGGRTAELPFFPEGGEQPSERSASFGLGAIFRAGAGAPAEVNAALELGTRGDLEDVGLEESFRRLTIGFTLRT